MCFLCYYPAYKRGQFNVYKLERGCNISCITNYKYINLLE